MKKLYLLIFICLLAGCDSGKKAKEKAFIDSLNKMKAEEPAISNETISEIIQQIPAPLEISVLIKEAGAKYDKSILNPAENIKKYNSNFHKALNLGIYGTDLGYTNIYEQNQDAIFYLNSIKDLADDLSIGQFFDFGTIQRLATNSRNLDSLLLITTKNFNNINEYLQGQQRSNLSILILTGGWLEALHITCKVAEKSGNNKELEDRIGEQRIILENIMLLLEFSKKSDPKIEELHKNLTELQTVFATIEIKEVHQEPTYEIVNGVMMVKDNNTTEVKITKENIKDITRITEIVRSKIIS